jgi:hypothetical protein
MLRLKDNGEVRDKVNPLKHASFQRLNNSINIATVLSWTIMESDFDCPQNLAGCEAQSVSYPVGNGGGGGSCAGAEADHATVFEVTNVCTNTCTPPTW